VPDSEDKVRHVALPPCHTVSRAGTIQTADFKAARHPGARALKRSGFKDTDRLLSIHGPSCRHRGRGLRPLGSLGGPPRRFRHPFHCSYQKGSRPYTCSSTEVLTLVLRVAEPPRLLRVFEFENESPILCAVHLSPPNPNLICSRGAPCDDFIPLKGDNLEIKATSAWRISNVHHKTAVDR
jgi:hypothetical protein